MRRYDNGKRSASLSIVKPHRPRLHAAGVLATDLKPGTHPVECLSAKTEARGKTLIVQLTHRTTDSSAVLHQWLHAGNAEGLILPKSKFARQCALALNREILATDDLDPEIVFVGKSFTADVGYRKTEPTGKTSDANANTWKDPTDFLRVHELLKLVIK